MTGFVEGTARKLRENCVETPIVGGPVSIQPSNIEKASMAIIGLMQGKHRLPTRLYTGSKVVSHSANCTNTMCVCLPALLHSYNIINDIFIQIWKHPCKGSNGVLISKTFNIRFDTVTDSTTSWCSARCIR